MISIDFIVDKNVPLVVICNQKDVIGVYRFDSVRFDFFEAISERQFMLCFDGRFKMYADVITLSYDDREVKLEAYDVTKLELEGFYERWYNARCKV